MPRARRSAPRTRSLAENWGYPVGVRRKVIAGTSALLAAVVVGAVAIGLRDGSTPSEQQPLQAKPSQQYGDDADLMRRLERKKLTTTSKQ